MIYLSRAETFNWKNNIKVIKEKLSPEYLVVASGFANAKLNINNKEFYVSINKDLTTYNTFYYKSPHNTDEGYFILDILKKSYSTYLPKELSVDIYSDVDALTKVKEYLLEFNIPQNPCIVCGEDIFCYCFKYTYNIRHENKRYFKGFSSIDPWERVYIEDRFDDSVFRNFIIIK